MGEILFSWSFANKIVIWILISIVCLLFEVGSPGLFFFLSFFFGAIFAAISAVITASWLIQSVIFLIFSFISFFVLSRWVKRRSSIIDIGMQTNVYAMRSKRGIVVKRITADTMGKVKVDGETWSARPHNGEDIENGTKVVIIRIKGAHLVVEEDVEI